MHLEAKAGENPRASVSPMTRIMEIGEKRSGTNVLRLLLNAHSKIVAPHSPHLLQRFTPLVHCFGDLSIERNFRRLVEYACAFTERDPVPWMLPSSSGEDTPFSFDRDEIFERCGEQSLIAVHGAMLDSFAEANGATAWVDKSGQSVRFARQLEDHYNWHGLNRPLYVWLHRHPVDVALSSLLAPVGPKTAFVAARQWSKLNRLCRELLERFGEERVFKLSFEDLVYSPTENLKELCAFLDLDYEPQMLEAHQTPDAARAAGQSSLWANLNRAVDPAQALKFRKRFLAGEPKVVDVVEVVERVAHLEMQAAGYELLTSAHEKGPFSSQEARAFEELDHRLQREAFATLSPEEREVRSQQYRMLDEIESLQSENGD